MVWRQTMWNMKKWRCMVASLVVLAVKEMEEEEEEEERGPKTIIIGTKVGRRKMVMISRANHLFFRLEAMPSLCSSWQPPQPHSPRWCQQLPSKLSHHFFCHLGFLLLHICIVESISSSCKVMNLNYWFHQIGQFIFYHVWYVPCQKDKLFLAWS